MSSPDNKFPNNWRKIFIKAFDRKHPRRVMDMIYTCVSLSDRQDAQERRRQELGENRIDRAYRTWSQLRPKNHKSPSTYEVQLLEIAERNREVDREVFQWLKAEIRVRHDFEIMRMEIGEAVFLAITDKDSRFFYELAKQWKIIQTAFASVLALYAYTRTYWQDADRSHELG